MINYHYSTAFNSCWHNNESLPVFVTLINERFQAVFSFVVFQSVEFGHRQLTIFIRVQVSEHPGNFFGTRRRETNCNDPNNTATQGTFHDRDFERKKKWISFCLKIFNHSLHLKFDWNISNFEHEHFIYPRKINQKLILLKTNTERLTGELINVRCKLQISSCTRDYESKVIILMDQYKPLLWVDFL